MPASPRRIVATLLVTALAVAGAAQTVASAQAAAKPRTGASLSVARFTRSVNLLRVKDGGTIKTPPKSTTSSARIRSTSTGDPGLDNYCQQVADLVNDALQQWQSDVAAGDEAGAQEWYALAVYMLQSSTSHGCKFTEARLRALNAHILLTGRVAVQR